MGVGGQGVGPYPSSFPDPRHGAEWEVEQCGHELTTIWDAGAACGDLAGYATTPTPSVSILMLEDMICVCLPKGATQKDT